MRNLKRALSLLLSSTMVLGMMVMGGSAAGYQDVDDSNDHQEAIEVLKAVGIMSGVDEDNFDPDGAVTRNQMAVIMAHLLNLDYDYYRGTNPFTDVPEWAAPYVAACAAEGVVAGIGDGKFGGDQKVTAAQAGLMIMKALGYFENAEDFGEDWQVATIRQASYINLFDQIDSNAETALNRAQVAQLVLNGLESDMVYFTGDKGIQIGDVTVGYRAEYTSKTSSDKKYNTLVSGKTDIANQGQYYIQLGEELYDGQLRKVNDADAFDRPAFTWSYKAQKIGTYVDWSLLVKDYTTAITGEDLYNILTSSAIKAYDVAYYVDGKASDVIKASNMIRTNDTNYKTTGNGVLTQVFVDNDEEEITITSINTFLAQATADYNDKKGTLSINVHQDAAKTTYAIDSTLSINDFAIADYKDGDMLRVTVAETSTNNYDVITIAEPDVMSDSTVTKFAKESYLVTGGEQYNYSKMGTGKNDLDDYYGSLLDNTYDIYMDAYGYVLGTVKVSGELKYLFLTGYDKAASHLSVKTSSGAAIFLDGTMKEIQIDVNDTNTNIAAYQSTYSATYYQALANGDNQYNKWFTYTTDKDGVYTLTPVTNWMDIKAPSNTDPLPAGEVDKINPASVRLNSSSAALGVNENGQSYAYGNDDSVYITVDTGAVSDNQGGSKDNVGITKVNGTYTGVQSVDLALVNDDNNGLSNMDQTANLNNSPAIFAVYDKDLYIIGAVVVGEDETNTKDYAYALKSAQNEYVDADGNYYWDFEAVVNGEIKTLTVKEKGTRVLRDRIGTWIGLGTASMIQVTYDADGYVIDALQCVDTALIPEQTDDKVYSNGEFNASTARDDYKVYDVYLNGANDESLMAVGNTLYVEKYTTEDIGLTIAANAPVVLVQQDTAGRWVINEYTTIKQALDALEDDDSGVLGVQFKGHIAAVLNSNTTAQYLVIKSETLVPVDTDDDSTPVKGFEKVTMNNAGVVTLQDKTGATVTTITNNTDYEYVLYMRGPGQEGYEVAQSGTLNVTAGVDASTLGTLVSSMEGASFYISVNGVASTPVLVPVTPPSP